MTDDVVDPFARDAQADPSPEQLAPIEGEWYQPYPERPRFRVLPRVRWPRDLPVTHERRWGDRRFYIESDNGVVGLVPWPGSHVVWPWEAAWHPTIPADVASLRADPKPESKRK